MNSVELVLRPIGVIHTPFVEASETPIQPTYAADAVGTVELRSEYSEGLADLDGFERIWLIYWFHRAGPPRMRVVPFLDSAERGLWATRWPCRPNPIGLSCVRLISIRRAQLTVAGVDMLDGTPLLDIKPYVPEFDAFSGARAGWLERRA
jgi:tRNA-Thr(GGU) m(6)t(6)A37 methyltransferase TsaA